MAPNIDAQQFMNLCGTNGFNTQGAINLAGTAIGGQSYGEIAWFSNAVQTMGNGTTEQKVQAGVNLFTKALSWFTQGAGVKEGNEAPVQTAKHTKDAKEVTEEQKKAQAELEKNIERVNKEIEAHIENIEAELDKLQAYGEDIAEKQKEAEDIQEQIKKKQAELENSEDKEGILTEIQELANQLGVISTEITALNQELEASKEITETEQDGIEEQTTEAETVTTNGQEDIARIQTQGNKSLSEASSDNNMAKTDKEAAIKLEAKAATTSTFTFGIGGATVQADIAGFNTGSGIRSNGAKAVESFAQFGLGGLQTNHSLLTNFDNGIGNYTNTFAGYLGSYNESKDSLSSTITSFGSLSQSSEEINKAVESDLQIVQSQEDDENSELQTSQVEIKEIETEV